MALTLRERLKAYFSPGAKPTAEQFAELIDTCLIQGEDGIDRSQQNALAIAPDVSVKGELKVDGPLLVAEHAETPASLVSQSGLSEHLTTTVQPLSVLPEGTILLWSGEQLPPGFQQADGSNNTPAISAPETINDYPVRWIIKR